MTTRFLKKVFAATVVLSMALSALPTVSFAASLSAPTDVSVTGGAYTNDTTPTITWNRPSGATWYEYKLNDGSWTSLSNVSSYTLWTLTDGWYTFFVRAHNSSATSATASVTMEIDTVGPTVPAVSPSTATEDESTTISVGPFGESAPAWCDLYVNGTNVGDMTKTGTTFIREYTFTNTGSYTVYAKCTDGDNNTTSGTSRSITVGDGDVDGTFIVPAVSLSTSTVVEDESFTMSVTPYGTLDAEACKLYVSGSLVGSMTEYSGTFKKSYSFANDGSYIAYAYCEDENGDWTKGTMSTVVVLKEGSTDEAPTVPRVSPSTATEDEEVTITVAPTSDEKVSWCDLYVNGDNVGDMDRNSDGTFEIDYTFTNDGSYTVYAVCTDASYDSTTGTSRTITVSNEDDNGTFTVPIVLPATATEDEATTISVTPYGTLDAEACKLYVEGSLIGSMTDYSGTFKKSYTFTNDGSYTAYAYCEDENGDWTKGSSRTIKVSNEDDSGTFTVPAVSPSTAYEDTATTISVTPYGTLDAEACKLYVSGSLVGSMTDYSGTFKKSYTFTNDGSYTAYAYCEDENGDWTRGSSRTIKVSNKTDVATGSLIKTACSAKATATDPCKAVYFYGDDGKRHVFANESVYFNWYSDFDDVETVSSSFMASLTIGKNVTYRPGSVLVKFDSSSKVYAVEETRTLRHYVSTSVLKSDYGADWKDVLVSVPDSLYSNYTIGNDIDSTSDFDRTEAYYSVSDINDLF